VAHRIHCTGDRIKNLDSSIALEVATVEGEQSVDSLHVHGGNKSCIMVARSWLGRDDPQLVEVLRDDSNGVTNISQCSNRPKCLFVLRIHSVRATNNGIA